MPAKKLLLVHGSCHGAWCWAQLLPELAARGIEARAIDLPGRGADLTPPAAVSLAQMAEAIVQAIAEMGGAVALLGHSAGGFAISAAASLAPQQVSKLIFLAAYRPLSGKSLIDMHNDWPQQPLRGHLARSAEGAAFIFKPESRQTLLYHDCDPATAAWAAMRLVPEPLGPQRTPLALSDQFARIEQHFLICAEDRVIPVGYQRLMAASLPPNHVQVLPAGHSPFLSIPALLAERIAALFDK